MADKQQLPDDFVLAEVSELDLYEKREKIYTRKIEGFFQRIREFTGWPLLGGYFLLPWLEWNGRQSVLFDLPARKFHVLGLTFWPQDLSMLAWLLIIAALALFLVTALAGRVWCGYTCPQTVWTSIFMWVEQKVEGTRNQRMRLDAQPWSPRKAGKKALKHGMWLAVAFYTGFTFVGYFTPIRELTFDLLSLSMHPWAVFWIGLFTLATYGNAGWLREQVCLYMCPYARFQSAMFDKDTLIISYDAARGEPRGSRKRAADPKELGLGDCIDCEMCNQVCPTGIDIRDGLQYQCIGCALCIDACNSVMDKMDYPRGLIRYTTEHALAGGKTHILRPRVIGFALVLVIMVVALGVRLALRVPFEVSVIRDRQQLFYETAGGEIENRYLVRIANKNEAAREYRIRITGLDGYRLQGRDTVAVASGQVEDVDLRLVVDRDDATGNRPISFVVVPVDGGHEVAGGHAAREIASRFIGPLPVHDSGDADEGRDED